ncbi:TPA: protein Eaa [Salmonella enterica]
MTTITRERLLKIQQWSETYGAGSNVMLPAEEAEELARIALASLEAEPIGAFHIADQQVDGTTDYIKDGEWPIDNGVIDVYAAPPAPVDNEFIPKNLDKALGVVGVALPESKEEFNFQIERWIQRLIDRVIRYADEFKEQPTPVVPDERAAFNAWNNEDNLPIAGVGAKNAAWLAWQARASLCGNSALNVPPERPADSSNGDDIEAWFDEGWNACRAAMLNGGKS